MTDLGYHPNVAARTLRSARTETLCFLLLDEGNRFLADPMTDLIIAGIGDVARDRGYGLLIRAARPHEPDPALIKPLLENRADGAFLFMSGEPELRQWYVNRLGELGFPFILLEPFRDPKLLTVTAADREGARALTEHLIAQGHKRIAFQTTKVPWPMLEQAPARLPRTRSRRPGSSPCLTGGTWDPTSGAGQAERLLSGKSVPTAMMCGNDLLALGAIRAVRERGLSVPEDIAVTGFDDFDFAQFADPALTTVRIPGYDIGGGRRGADRRARGQPAGAAADRVPGHAPAARVGVSANGRLIHADVFEEAVRLLAAAQQAGVKVRTLGGMAIVLHVGDRLHPAFVREIHDIDLATPKRESRKVADFLSEQGYRPTGCSTPCTAIAGCCSTTSPTAARSTCSWARSRLPPAAARAAARGRGDDAAARRPGPDQAPDRQAQPQGAHDLYSLLLTHEVADHDADAVNATWIAELCGRDWGLFRTVQLNLERLRTELDVPELTPARPRRSASAQAARAGHPGRAQERQVEDARPRRGPGALVRGSRRGRQGGL